MHYLGQKCAFLLLLLKRLLPFSQHYLSEHQFDLAVPTTEMQQYKQGEVDCKGLRALRAVIIVKLIPLVRYLRLRWCKKRIVLPLNETKKTILTFVVDSIIKKVIGLCLIMFCRPEFTVLASISKQGEKCAVMFE